jgi:alpha-L-fucosidase 2
MKPMPAVIAMYILLGTVLWSPVVMAGGAAQDLLIWFDAPALQFTQSLPLGNGRLGAMIFGGLDEERIVLNEGSLWSR